MAQQLQRPSPFLQNRDKWLHESEYCFVYDNDFPIIPGHVLLLPKREIENFDQISSAEWIDIKFLTDQYINNCGAIGFNLAHNSGLIAGQSVAHIHFHIFPHFEGSSGMPEGGYGAAFGNLPDYYKQD